MIVQAHVEVPDQVLQDLAKSQSHDGKIVAPQTQNGNADDHAHDACHNAADDHSQQQPDCAVRNNGLDGSGHHNAGESADAHETGVAQAQLTRNTNHQVQRNRQHDINADRDQLALQGTAECAHGI